MNLPKALTVVIRIRTDSTVLHGSVIATASDGAVKGLAVLDLVADESRGSAARISYDPHLVDPRSLIGVEIRDRSPGRRSRWCGELLHQRPIAAA